MKQSYYFHKLNLEANQAAYGLTGFLTKIII